MSAMTTSGELAAMWAALRPDMPGSVILSCCLASSCSASVAPPGGTPPVLHPRHRVEDGLVISPSREVTQGLCRLRL